MQTDRVGITLVHEDRQQREWDQLYQTRSQAAWEEVKTPFCLKILYAPGA